MPPVLPSTIHYTKSNDIPCLTTLIVEGYSMNIKQLTLYKFFAPIVAGVIVIVLFFSMSKLYQNTAMEQERATHIERLAEIRAKIEGSLNGATNLTMGLIAHIRVTGSIEPSLFENLSNELLIDNPLIRNITLAPQNIIQYVFPLQNNEAALGLDLLNHPIQGAATRAILETQQPILAGPFELAQGGVGVIHRVPIYIKEGSEKRYWGLMSTPIDFSELIEKSGLNDPNLDIRVSMRSTADPSKVFYGQASLFSEPEVFITQVSILNGSWDIAAIPKIPYGHSASNLVLGAKIAGLILGGIAALLTFQLIATTEKLHYSQQRYQNLAQHDSLTGLPNRSMFQELYRSAIARAQRQQYQVALLFMDLNKFKQVNDEFGHQVGDVVLKEVANRFRQATRGSDAVMRIGGDEFILLLEDIKELSGVQCVAEKIIESLRDPIEIEGYKHYLGVSIGIALYPQDGQSFQELISAGDKAMYTAKREGKTDIYWYSGISAEST